MSDVPPPSRAEVVVPCGDLDATAAWFQSLGFRIESVLPADAPRTMLLSGHGLRLRLSRDAPGDPGRLRLIGADPSAAETRLAPNGTTVEIVAAPPDAVAVPRGVAVRSVQRVADGPGFSAGRAGMQYRDLVPDRVGGRYIVSHIRIVDGGPVPDYVHYHRVALQMIFCHRGWVEVVYEDQGPPLTMQAGDCVVQPPGIRHRVLSSSAGCEVVELGCPAAHETLVDHDLTLPTAEVKPDREFGGQRFVWHRADEAVWVEEGPRRVLDLGLYAATAGRLAAQRVQLRGDGGIELGHDDELRLGFVRAGGATLRGEGHAPVRLAVDDAFVIPAGTPHRLDEATADFEWLDLRARVPS